MKDLLDRISSYNLFNYLLPGILFVFMSKTFVGYDFIQENTLMGIAFYYFIGMVISRLGSLIVEPILRKVSFVVFADYKSFVSASKKDQKIELFSEVNNTYRTIMAMFILLLLSKGYRYLEKLWNISNEISAFIMVVLSLGVFHYAYRKQTSYITKRIDANK